MGPSFSFGHLEALIQNLNMYCIVIGIGFPTGKISIPFAYLLLNSSSESEKKVLHGLAKLKLRC